MHQSTRGTDIPQGQLVVTQGALLLVVLGEQNIHANLDMTLDSSLYSKGCLCILSQNYFTHKRERERDLIAGDKS